MKKNLIKGKLKLESEKSGTMIFEGAGRKQKFGSTPTILKQLFCNSTIEKALKGVNASWDGDRFITTDQWELKRTSGMLSGVKPLSKHFC